MKRIKWLIFLGGIVVASPFATTVQATELFRFSMYVPVLEGSEKAHLEKMEFDSSYSPTETVVNSVTWDPCQAVGKSPGCGAVNPLKLANVRVNVYAYEGTSKTHPDGCYVIIDTSGYKPLPPDLASRVDSTNTKIALIKIAIDGLKKGTLKNTDYTDCEIRFKGLSREEINSAFHQTQYLNPVIPNCRPHTIEGQRKARELNNQGMRYYGAGKLEEAAESFRLASAEDCQYFISRTNLASVLSLQKKYHQSLAVLWRAIKLDKNRTLSKLLRDPDYDGLKRSYVFSSAATPVGQFFDRYRKELARYRKTQQH